MTAKLQEKKKKRKYFGCLFYQHFTSNQLLTNILIIIWHNSVSYLMFYHSGWQPVPWLPTLAQEEIHTWARHTHMSKTDECISFKVTHSCLTIYTFSLSYFLLLFYSQTASFGQLLAEKSTVTALQVKVAASSVPFFFFSCAAKLSGCSL